MDSEKVKLYFLMNSIGLDSVDMSRPDLGNPGVGGTQFCFLLLGYYLNKIHSKNYDVIFISYNPLKLPLGITNVIINDINSLENILLPHSILIVKDSGDETFYDIIDKLKNVSVITWAHNYLFGSIANRISKSNNIKANVFVSKQMYDRYIDNDIIKKSVPIFNIVPDVNAPLRVLPKEPTITFMGQISEAKGILTLMKIWKKVKLKYPNAHLNIIGKGTLYNRSVKLGVLGLTDERTEQKILPYITDDYGALSPNVHLLGLLGSEKYDVFANSTVGIVNPSARTETFGMGIIEMATCALPVVTKNWNGHPDTAINGITSLLAFTTTGMADRIIKLFENHDLNYNLGHNAKKGVSRFTPDVILPQWENLFKSIINSQSYNSPTRSITHPYINNYKFIRAFNSVLRFKLKLSFLPSIVEIEYFLYNIIKSIIR